MMPKKKQTISTETLTLQKQDQQWVFRYETGREAAFLQGIADRARDPECELTWFDAALLSHQIGQRLKDRVTQRASHTSPAQPSTAPDTLD